MTAVQLQHKRERKAARRREVIQGRLTAFGIKGLPEHVRKPKPKPAPVRVGATAIHRHRWYCWIPFVCKTRWG